MVFSLPLSIICTSFSRHECTKLCTLFGKQQRGVTDRLYFC